MSIKEMRLSILQRVERGELSIEDGSRLLAELDEIENEGFTERVVGETDLTSPQRMSVLSPQPVPEVTAQPVDQAPLPVVQQPMADRVPAEVVRDPGSDEEVQRRIARWRRWWVYPFAVGVLLTILSAYWMYLGYRFAGFGWGFWLSWFPFIAGLLILVASWYTRTARWLHVRVREDSEKNSSRVSISLPLPLGLVAWFLETFGKKWLPPEIREKGLGEMLREMEKSITADEPFHVWVDDKGSQVEVMIIGGKSNH